MRNNRFAHWIVSGFSVLAFLVLVRYLSAYLPNEGFLGSVRKVISLGG